MYLGIKAVIAKSYARIHRQNLINSGIPCIYEDADDYKNINLLDELWIDDLSDLNNIELLNNSYGKHIKLSTDLTAKEAEIIRAGGLLNTIKAM